TSSQLAAVRGMSLMIRSLRGRLLAWYAFVLLTAIGGFAGILYSLTRAARFEQVDVRLVSAAEYLDAVLRSMPRGILEAGGEPAGLPRRDKPGGSPSGAKGRPGPRSEEHTSEL